MSVNSGIGVWALQHAYAGVLGEWRNKTVLTGELCATYLLSFMGYNEMTNM